MGTAQGNDRDFNDVVLPAQYWSAAINQAAQPEKKLMAAVLEEAISVLVRTSGGREHQQAEREALAWMESEDRREPFGFASICDILGLDPTGVRNAITRLRCSGESFVRPRMSAGRGRHRIRQKRRRRSAA